MLLARFFVLTLLLLGLSACNTQTVKPAQETADLKDVATTQQRAKLAYDSGNWTNAEKHYLILTQQLPRDAETWFRLGNVYTRLNRPNEAIKAYQESLARNPDNSKTWHNLGIVQLKQATNTFIQLQNYSEPGDALNNRAGFVVNAMSQIMEKGFGVSADDTAR